MHVLKDALAKELFGSVAEDTLHGRTLVADDALGVDNGDDVQGVLDERTELALAAVYLAAEFPQAGVLHGAGEGLPLEQERPVAADAHLGQGDGEVHREPREADVTRLEEVSARGRAGIVQQGKAVGCLPHLPPLSALANTRHSNPSSFF